MILSANYQIRFSFNQKVWVLFGRLGVHSHTPPFSSKLARPELN